EGERYPHLFESWRQHGPGKLTTALSALLARLAQKGALVIDDFDLAARQFVALGNADLQMMTLFGGTPSDAELEKAARNAVRTFLRAYGRPAADKAGAQPQLAALSG
ncbi:TetR/AcrR family transcriptional regulator C-terminal domain-containing protein, partial [Rhizobium phaseoli]